MPATLVRMVACLVCVSLIGSAAFSQLAQVRLTTDMNVRTVTGGNLVVETILPKDSIVEVSVSEFKNAKEMAYGAGADRLAFVKNIKIISAPGFSEEKIASINNIGRTKSLHMAKTILAKAIVVAQSPEVTVVRTDKPAEVVTENTVPPPTPSPTPKKTAETPTNRTSPASCPVKIDDPGPARYFTFASDSAKKGINASRIASLVSTYGRNIVIGGDPGDGSDFTNLMAAAEKAGVKRHVYLEGPKGPTGDSGFQGGEWQRLLKAAAKYKIYPKSQSSSDPGMIAWNKTGWRLFTREQITDYATKGFDTYEVDNMERGFGSAPSGLISFLKEQQAWLRTAKDGKGRPIKMKLVLKNLNVNRIEAVEAAIKSGQLDRNMFADFAISERESDSNKSAKELARQKKLWADQAEAGKRIGIQVLPSGNTYSYDASGKYEVAKCVPSEGSAGRPAVTTAVR